MKARPRLHSATHLRALTGLLSLSLFFGGAPAALGQGKPAFASQGPGGFHLRARAARRWVGNRVQCFLSADGHLCTAESSVVGGGYWPKNTSNQYIFSTGLWIAGIVDSASANNPWAGDIEGAFFFNPRGGGNGQAITDIYDASDPADLAAWPADAYLPSGTDSSATLYDAALQGARTASDDDIWFLGWEGDPNLLAGRRHPLGVLVETRGLTFTARGKEDILFFVFTLYNISANNPDAYNDAPPRLQARLREAGVRFHQLNAANGTVLPEEGYTIKDMYLAMGADMDVTFSTSGTNFDGVNVPLGMGFTYQASFTADPFWSFDDPVLFGPPFFKGAGFVGVKFLKTPESNGQAAGLSLFASLTGGGEFSSPRNTQAMYRMITGHPDSSVGDDQCNIGNIAVTRICYVNQGSPSDTKFFQSTGPLTLLPGGYGSVAVAYLFAAPVASGLCTGPGACGQVPPQVPTGDLTRFTNPALLTLGANRVDSIAGFRGWRDTTFIRTTTMGDTTVFPNGLVDQEELITIPGSLMGKALTAQTIFDSRFLAPVPPAAPDFFLIPGADQVTVIWRPSLTESVGDRYFVAAQDPRSFDPNYRQFDVAGYRIYRGNRSDPGSLKLLAQFDIQGDSWVDRTGQINQLDSRGYVNCAPDLGIFKNCVSAGMVDGVATIVPRAVGLDGSLIQWQEVIPTGAGIDTVVTIDSSVVPPDTTTTYVPVNSRAYVTKADTALSGGGSGKPQLTGSGVPFMFVDRAGNCPECGVHNHRSYDYVVSAFDINSIRSGPSSLESALSPKKSITPAPPPVNISSTGTLEPIEILDHNGVALTDSVVPTLDPSSGRFSKPFPPSNGATLSLKSFLPAVLPTRGGVRLRLDDVELGSSYSFPAQPITYRWMVFTASDSATLVTTMAQDPTDITDSTTAVFDAVPLDSAAAGKYGGSGQFVLQGQLDQTLVGTYYTNAWGRGCINGAAGFLPAAGQTGCDYNGSRWFLGPSPTTNETKANPTLGNGQNSSSAVVNNTAVIGGIANNGFNNAGALPNVEVIHQPYSYQTMGSQWRDVEGVLSGAKRAADYNVYWSATTAGLIDRVQDVTHNVEVPFLANRLGASYGLLTTASAQPSGVGQSFDARSELSLADFGCVEPLRSTASDNGGPGRVIPCGGTTAGGDGPIYTLTRQAEIGPIVHFTGSTANSQSSTNTGQGFGMYIAGNLFMFQTTTLPAGTVWSLRDYVGAITGGNGFGGNDGPYAFAPVVRPFSAVGASLRLSFTANTVVALARNPDLRQVHTVPDPYYRANSLETSATERIIKFVNLPERAIIRIYTVSGVLVTVIEHNSLISSEAVWDVRNRNGRIVASGVYLYHVEALNARRVGRMTVVTDGR